MNKRKFLIPFIVLSIIAISSAIYARYIINKNLDITFRAVPFEFETDMETTRIRMLEDSIDFSVFVKSYIGSDRIDEINYTISMEDNTKFNIEGTGARTISVNNYDTTIDEVKLTLNKNTDLAFRNKENITLIVEVESPYKRTIEIPIDIYTTENEDIYYITYIVEVDGVVLKTNADKYDGITLDSVFGANRPDIIENNSFSFNVSIPGNYTADTYTADFDAENSYKNEVKENDYPLGANPVYVVQGGKIVADTTKGPAELSFNATYYDNTVGVDKVIIVRMTKKVSIPVFDARIALGLAGMSGRGSSGTYNGDSATNINPENNNWNWASYATDTKPMTSDGNGKYTHTWVFQTNSGNWLLDSLEMNGVAINIPFSPGLTTGTNSTGATPVGRGSLNSTTTILHDGAKVTLEYIKIFGTQRVYQITIEDALSDIVLTDANLHDNANGAPEIVIYKLVGLNSLESNWGNTHIQSNVVVLTKGREMPEFKFKLFDHYENPKVSFVDLNDKPISGINDVIIEQTSDGYYNISNLPYISSGTIGLLTIAADPVRYAVEYDLGDIDENNVEFATLLDDNDGNYYTVDNTQIITIRDQKPIDITDEKEFVGWKLNGKNIDIDRGKIFSLDEFAKYAVPNEDGVYVLKLQAYWRSYD